MGKRVLVVDDDKDLRHAIVGVLEDEGHDVAQAADGKQALAAIDEARPDVVLLDLMMPVMSGWDVLRALDSRTNAPRVVVLTAGRTATVPGRTVLRKPVALEELVAVVARAA